MEIQEGRDCLRRSHWEDIFLSEELDFVPVKDNKKRDDRRTETGGG